MIGTLVVVVLEFYVGVDCGFGFVLLAAAALEAKGLGLGLGRIIWGVGSRLCHYKYYKSKVIRMTCTFDQQKFYLFF